MKSQSNSIQTKMNLRASNERSLYSAMKKTSSSRYSRAFLGGLLLISNAFGQNVQTTPVASLAQQDTRTEQSDGGFQSVPSAGGAPAAVTQKKPGTIRIGVTQPKAQIGQGNSGPNVADPLRTMIMQYLSGPAFDVVPITAMLTNQMEAEALQKQCDYVLYTNITLKTKSGGMGLLSKLGPAASMVPVMGPMAGIAGIAVSAGAAAGSASSGAASAIRAKGDITFDYKLTAPGGATPVIANTLKAKAAKDGEDAISPLIEQAASAILNTISKSNQAGAGQ